MTDTQWSEPFTGPEMRALGDGAKDVPCRIEGTRWNRNETVGYWDIPSSRANYCLPADHPAVTVALHNRKHGTSFAYWPGGDEAPGDWDGDVYGVLYRDGNDIGRRARNWKHFDAPHDIIGYHKRTEQPAEVVGEVPEWAFRRAEDLAGCNFSRTPGGVAVAFARYIAQHEQPPVDPLEKALETIVPIISAGFAGETPAQTVARKLRVKMAEQGLQIVPVSA